MDRSDVYELYSLEICSQVKKQQLELNTGQQIASK